MAKVQDRRLPGLCAVAWATAFCAGCYNPELGPTEPNNPNEPFLCSPTGKECPDGFECNRSRVPRVCVPEGSPLDAAVPDQGVCNFDGSTKDGSMHLDGPCRIEPSDNCLDNAVEPNNTGATAWLLKQQGRTTGWQICYPGDIDHFAIEVEQGQAIDVTIEFDHKKGDLDAALLHPNGGLLRQSRSDDNDEKLDLPGVTEAGKYVIGVVGFGGAVNTYSLLISLN